MPRQEAEEIIVKGLQGIAVRTLVGLHEGIDQQADWNTLDRLKEEVKVGQVDFSYGLILWVLD